VAPPFPGLLTLAGAGMMGAGTVVDKVLAGPGPY
jgi:hypothetical protein